VETTRDLGQIELWQQSLERSLARRGKLARSSVELHRLVPERDLAAPELLLESTSYWQARRRAAASHPAVPRPVVALGGVSALTLVSVTTLPTLLGASRHRRGLQTAFAAQLPQATVLGNGQRRSVASIAVAPAPAPIRQSKPKTQTVSTQPATTTPARTTATVVHPAPAPAHAAKPAPKPATVAAKPAKLAAKPATADHVAKAPKLTVTHPVTTAKPRPTTAPKPAAPKPATSAHKPAPKPEAHKPAPPPKARKPKPPAPRSGYVNPLAHARVTPERIDQGVDYAGTGTLTAIGRARITYAATTGTGWPGAFIEYRLLNGPDAGRYVYYAEGERPVSGISVGKVVAAGQPVAYLIPGWSTGIEIGWGAGIGTETYAAEHGQHTYPTPAGESFSALIASLGGPPGR
jgi:hypothetical protein